MHGCAEIWNLFRVLTRISHECAKWTIEISCSKREIISYFQTFVYCSVYYIKYNYLPDYCTSKLGIYCRQCVDVADDLILFQFHRPLPLLSSSLSQICRGPTEKLLSTWITLSLIAILCKRLWSTLYGCQFVYRLFSQVAVEHHFLCVFERPLFVWPV